MLDATMRIYTKTGDDGETGLFGNVRVPKTHLRVEAYGSVDELNSFLGMLRAEETDEGRDAEIREIQAALFDIGADLATPGAKESLERVQAGIQEMEGWIDRDSEALPPLKTFILPGGHRLAALYHVLRTVCRRAERRVWDAVREEGIPAPIGTYLNRLSDLFFTWARQANHRHGTPDVEWVRHAPSGD